MAHFGFLTWGGAGNQTPATGLAAELAGRGHAVTFAGYAQQRARFAGSAFRLLRNADRAWPADPPDWLPALVDAVWACPAHLDDVPEVAADCDLLVIDCLMFGALAAAERLPVPAAVLVHSAPGALAPPGGGMDMLALPAVNAVRGRAGLPEAGALWECWQPFPVLCTSLPALDPLADRLPAGFAFVGPIFEPHPPSGRALPWPPDDPRPLVLVSFSTGIAWDQGPRIRRTVEALAGGEHRVVVTTGMAQAGDLDAGPDVLLTPFLPHAELLPAASVIVTHAGHGTVAASLANGVPMVCLPNPAADQPVLADRVAALGAGVALDGEQATAAEIADAVRTVRSDGGYAEAAARAGKEIAALPGVTGTADRLESLVP